MDIRIIIAAWYLICCVIIAATAANRGHHFAEVFALCLFASPLIAAIIYSHKK